MILYSYTWDYKLLLKKIQIEKWKYVGKSIIISTHLLKGTFSITFQDIRKDSENILIIFEFQYLHLMNYLHLLNTNS